MKGKQTGAADSSARIGASYEERAAAYLISIGHRILERNFRCRTGEIDIISREGDCLVFTEVKYRSGSGSGSPESFVDARKRMRISRAAAFYLLRHGLTDTCPCRFDVIAFLGEKMTHIRAAFDYEG